MGSKKKKGTKSRFRLKRLEAYFNKLSRSAQDILLQIAKTRYEEEEEAREKKRKALRARRIDEEDDIE